MAAGRPFRGSFVATPSSPLCSALFRNLNVRFATVAATLWDGYTDAQGSPSRFIEEEGAVCVR